MSVPTERFKKRKAELIETVLDVAGKAAVATDDV